MSLLGSGTVIGRDFVLEHPLGAGGMGTVFVATQTTTGIRRAVKLMQPEIVRDERLRERFVQEARIGGLIPSDHVVQVIAAGIDDNTSTPFLVMELLEGLELATAVQLDSAVGTTALALIFEQLCHAVGAAHRAGIVHRDLKPENIFLARARTVGTPFTVKVLDFGIAKLVAEARARTTEPIGTPLWMAPEQTARGSSVSPRTDVWALGLIAFFCLTGKPYWASPGEEQFSMQRLLREILIDDLVLPSERARAFGASLPAWFDSWFQRCVHRDVKARFHDANDLWRELAHCLHPRGEAKTEPMLESPVSGVAAAAPFEQEHRDARPPKVARSPAPAADAALSREGTTPIVGASDREVPAPPQPPARMSGTLLLVLPLLAIAGFGLVSVLQPGPSRNTTQTHVASSDRAASVPLGTETAAASDADSVTSKVKAWNVAHATKDIATFKALYAESVLYYGTLRSSDTCVRTKQTFLTENAGYRQDVIGDIRIEHKDEDFRATFLKRVSLRDKVTDYPSYLVFRKVRVESGLTEQWRIVTEGDTVTDANLEKSRLDFATRKSTTTLYSSLIATVGGREHVLVPESADACLAIEDQRDFDGNGTRDALVRQITGCGGNCCGDSFFFATHVGDGRFQQSESFGYAWGKPKIEEWNGQWSVLVTSNNEGANLDDPVEITERFVLASGKAVPVDKFQRPWLVAEAELKSSDFNFDKDDEQQEFYFDLDGDGLYDRIFGELWKRWGRINWTVTFSKGKKFESGEACKRIGVLKTSTRGVRDLVCDQDSVLRWNGARYE